MKRLVLLLFIAFPALSFAQPPNRAAQLFEAGRRAMLDDDAEAAATQFEQAVALEPNVSDYHLWLGNALAQQAGRASKFKQPFLAKRVMAEFERAVALDARSVDARDSLVDFYSMAPGFMGGGADKARAQAEALARLDAMRGHLALARMAINAKDASAVEREMNAAIAAGPDSVRPYAALSNWYIREKKWPQAFAVLDPYIKKHPEDPYGPFGIGRVAAASGQELQRGEQALRSFIAKPPKDAGAAVLSRAYQRLGQVLEYQGKRAEARSAIEQAVRINPRNEEAKKALK